MLVTIPFKNNCGFWLISTTFTLVLLFVAVILPTNLELRTPFMWTLNVTFLLILRNATANLSCWIPGHGCGEFFLSLFSLFQWKFSEFGS